MLVTQFILKLLQSPSDSDGTQPPITLLPFLTRWSILFWFFCHPPPLWPVARKQYQINARSYLVTLLISCGPALPCGCCSRDDGDEEKGGGGWHCGSCSDNRVVTQGGEAFNGWVNKCGTYGALHCQGHHVLNKYSSHFTFSRTKAVFWCLQSKSLSKTQDLSGSMSTHAKLCIVGCFFFCQGFCNEWTFQSVSLTLRREYYVPSCVT